MSKLPASEEAKERVLKVHPEAVALDCHEIAGDYNIYSKNGADAFHLGNGTSTTKAWIDAASRIPALSEDQLKRLAFLRLSNEEKMKHCVFCGDKFGPNEAGHINCGGKLLDVKLPAPAEDGIDTGDVMEMASSGATIRKAGYDLFFVEWGNVRFGTSLNGMSVLAHDLELFVSRARRVK